MSLDLTTILVGVALLLAAYVKGTTGLGFPLIATPMVALLLDIRTAITILIIPNIVMGRKGVGVSAGIKPAWSSG